MATNFPNSPSDGDTHVFAGTTYTYSSTRGAWIAASNLTYPLVGFSSTGIDDNADALAITIDSSENVGVGTTTPSYKLDVNGQINTTTLSIGGTAITATAAELNYVDGVTSNIQTQLDSAASTGKAIAMAIVFGG